MLPKQVGLISWAVPLWSQELKIYVDVTDKCEGVCMGSPLVGCHIIAAQRQQLHATLVKLSLELANLTCRY